jgi:HAD superfamily hydrolase (TIGR01509 family)
MIINHNLETDRIKALIFDVDGTLSDSDDRMVETLYERLLFLKFFYPEEKLLRFSRRFIHFAEGPGNWILEMADRLDLDHLIAAFFDRRANAKVHLPHHYPLIPGVMPMLETLIGRYPVAIVTARNEVTTREFLRTNALDGYFPIVISSQTCKKTKPFPEPLLHAADRMNVPIENCLMIGDTVTDVRAALAAGAQSVSVLCGFGQEKELRKSGTHAILNSTAQLADFLSETQLDERED